MDLDARIPWATSAEQLRGIDGWRRRQPDLPTRSKAIGQLVQWALENYPKTTGAS